MRVQELPTKMFLAHLRRNPIPEIMDDECLSALKSIEAVYGDTITHGAGLEVRLGEEARYVDYIMNIDEDAIPDVESLWYEIDYAEFKKAAETGEKISPCLFANTDAEKSRDASYWDALLPPFLGEARAKKLRPAFDRLLKALPKGVHIKQIGTMTGRGEISIMRLVIRFPKWEMIPGGMEAIGWTGDAEAFQSALEPWKEALNISVNIDLGEKGVLPKVGVEVFSRWRHPLIVDKFLARLEEAGLCLKSKADALRRWIRIRPDGDPFIQTLIAYFKLNYKDGKITEAKAYLEQSPYTHHHYFDAYEMPARLDVELTNVEAALPVGEALSRIDECVESRVLRLRFFGAEKYEDTSRLLSACRDRRLHTELVLRSEVGKEHLSDLIADGAETFLVEVHHGAEKDTGMRTLSLLKELGFSDVRAKWSMTADNWAKLSEVVKGVEELGAKELAVEGLCTGGEKFLNREAFEESAKFIREYKSKNRMKLKVSSCFSQLRAYLGGEDPRLNGNRGIICGCEAGRSFCAVSADGKLLPCLKLVSGEKEKLGDYWKKSSALKALRNEKNKPYCAECAYVRRCRPCAAPGVKIEECPLKSRQ